MQTTLTLDDSLLTQASAIAGIQQPGALIHFALRALVERAPRKIASPGKLQTPYVITGPFMQSKPGLWEGRSPADLLTELEDQDFIDQQARVASGDTL